MYKTVKTQLGWKRDGPPQKLIIEGKQITAPKQLADEQLRYFKKKFKQSTRRSLDPQKIP